MRSLPFLYFVGRTTLFSSLVGAGVWAGVYLGSPAPVPAPPATSCSTSTLQFAPSISVDVDFSPSIVLNVQSEKPSPWVPLATVLPLRKQKESLSFSFVEASRYQPGVFVAWRAQTAFVTRDDGKSFEEVRCPQKEQITEATFTKDGTLFVLCGDTRLLAQSKGSAVERTLPFQGSVQGFTSNATSLVWFGSNAENPDEYGETLLMRSSDQGKTWKAQTLSQERDTLGNDSNQIYLSESGELQVLGGNEASCGGGYQFRYMVKLGGSQSESLNWPLDSPGNFAVGPDGWAYGFEYQYEPPTVALMGISTQEEATSVVSSPAPEEGSFSWTLESNAERSLLLWGSSLFSVDGAQKKLITHEVPEGFELRAVTQDGGALGILNGYLARWSPSESWRILQQAQ